MQCSAGLGGAAQGIGGAGLAAGGLEVEERAEVGCEGAGGVVGAMEGERSRLQCVQFVWAARLWCGVLVAMTGWTHWRDPEQVSVACVVLQVAGCRVEGVHGFKEE